MKKSDAQWFIRHALIALPYIPGNKDQERYAKLLASIARELKRKPKAAE